MKYKEVYEGWELIKLATEYKLDNYMVFDNINGYSITIQYHRSENCFRKYKGINSILGEQIENHYFINLRYKLRKPTKIIKNALFSYNNWEY